MFQKILVPLDGSARAEQAIPVAARIARGVGGSLVLLRVIPRISDYAWRSLDPPVVLPDVLAKERAEAAVYLQRLLSSQDLDGVGIQTEVRDGDPAYTILTVAHELQATMMVMCSHGERGIKRWMMGSVSLKVARHSAIPVFVLRPNEQGISAPFTSKGSQVRILVPLDGSKSAEEALEPAMLLAHSLTAPVNAALHLACVLLADDEERERAIQAAQEYLAEVEKKLLQSEAGRSITITSSISLHVDAAQALIRLAEHGEGMREIAGFTGCDIIAIATHGRSGVPRWVMGSVTERILDSTTLPLLIVRPQKVHAKPTEEHHDGGSSEQRAKDDTVEEPSWAGLF
ncbi:MAG: universal stress protein [Ktedonobacteraceae bacterium]|nr:universal stress protein [Ktedonobacteraceae bacterium]